MTPLRVLGVIAFPFLFVGMVLICAIALFVVMAIEMVKGV